MSKPACPACGSNEFESREHVSVADQHKLYAPDDEPTQRALTAVASEATLHYQMLCCTNCGLEFCDPMTAPSAEWYRLAYRALDLFSLERWEFDEILLHIPQGASVFEFGCGTGNFLDRCQKRGRVGSGMDFSEDAVVGCVAKGLNVRQMDLNAPATKSDLVPHIAALHCLEHIEQPAILFEHAAAKAAPSAHLWISVPSDRRPTRRFRSRDYLDQPPHHMTRWTPEAFRQAGMRYGWRLVETLYEPLSFRAALWSIAAYSPRYKKWNSAGRFRMRLVERTYRALVLPATLVRYLQRERRLSGFSMLAHFVFEER
jgi:SAM-dependent methyltransferase